MPTLIQNASIGRKVRPPAHEARVVSVDGVLRLSGRSGPLQWNFRHDPFHLSGMRLKTCK
jgi:hypothetical protein